MPVILANLYSVIPCLSNSCLILSHIVIPFLVLIVNYVYNSGNLIEKTRGFTLMIELSNKDRKYLYKLIKAKKLEYDRDNISHQILIKYKLADFSPEYDLSLIHI